MATYPLVLLVEPDLILRELVHGELKNVGCIVVDAATGDEALAFATLYPGPIDFAVTDLAQHDITRFAHALRSLPTGTETTFSCLPDLFDRSDLIRSVRQFLPTPNATPFGIETKPEEGDGAVFWGAQHDSAAVERRPAVNG